MNTPIEVEANEQISTDIKLGEALSRLRKNKDFKLIVNELYLEGGSINLTKNIVVVKDQDAVVEQIKSRGHLYRFLMELDENHKSASAALADMQQEQED